MGYTSQMIKKPNRRKNILLTFKWQKKPWHIVGLIYSMSENAPKEGETEKGKDGSFSMFHSAERCQLQWTPALSHLHVENGLLCIYFVCF